MTTGITRPSYLAKTLAEDITHPPIPGLFDKVCFGVTWYPDEVIPKLLAAISEGRGVLATSGSILQEIGLNRSAGPWPLHLLDKPPRTHSWRGPRTGQVPNSWSYAIKVGYPTLDGDAWASSVINDIKESPYNANPATVTSGFDESELSCYGITSNPTADCNEATVNGPFDPASSPPLYDYADYDGPKVGPAPAGFADQVEAVRVRIHRTKLSPTAEPLARKVSAVGGGLLAIPNMAMYPTPKPTFCPQDIAGDFQRLPEIMIGLGAVNVFGDGCFMCAKIGEPLNGGDIEVWFLPVMSTPTGTFYHPFEMGSYEWGCDWGLNPALLSFALPGVPYGPPTANDAIVVETTSFVRGTLNSQLLAQGKPTPGFPSGPVSAKLSALADITPDLPELTQIGGASPHPLPSLRTVAIGDVGIGGTEYSKQSRSTSQLTIGG